MSWSLVLLSAVLLTLRLGGAVDAESTSSVEPTCTATNVGGRCERAPEGCPTVDKSSEECVPHYREAVDLRQYDCSSECGLINFCGGKGAINVTAEIPVNITYSVHNYRMFNITVSLKNLVGNLSYVMMMTNDRDDQKTGTGCACGSTGREASLSDYFYREDEDGQYINLHICLWNESSSVHLVRRFFAGSSCAKFIKHHQLRSRLEICNQPLDDELRSPIKKVNNLKLAMQATTAPMMQVSWTKPSLLPHELHGITYYLTLQSVLGKHTFTVSNSTNVTCMVSPGQNYTVIVKTWIWCEPASCQVSATSFALSPTLSPPTHTSTSSKHPIAMITTTTEPTTVLYSTNATVMIIFSLVFALSILFLLIVLIVVGYQLRLRKNRHSENEQCRMECTGISNSYSTETASTPHMETDSRTPSPTNSDNYEANCQVLIVGSQNIPTQQHAELVAVPLKAYKNIELLMHHVDTKEEDRRLTPNVWVQKAMDQAQFVVCICNREFMEDWYYNGEEMCQDKSLVRTVSEHVEGLANHGRISKVREKFIVVVSCEDDLQQYIPKNLKTCHSFVLNCEAKIESLARYLVGVPEYSLVDSFPHISSRH